MGDMGKHSEKLLMIASQGVKLELIDVLFNFLILFPSKSIIQLTFLKG